MKTLGKRGLSVKSLKIKDYSKRVDWDNPLNLEQLLAADMNKFTKRKQAKRSWRRI